MSALPDSKINRDSSSFKGPFSAYSLHIFVLASFAFQPLLDLLGRNPDFFIAHRTEPMDIVLFVLLLLAGFPLSLILFEALLAKISKTLWRLGHVFIVATLFALILPPFLMRAITEITGFGIVLVAYSMLLSAVLSATYLRYTWMRIFLSYCSPAILIFPGLFLINSPASKFIFRNPMAPGQQIQASETGLTLKNDKSLPPIIIIILDEFPVVSLMDTNEEIDPIRFPHFSAFAKDSYWFRNATTVHAETRSSITAILTGQYPNRSHARDYLDYPLHLYFLLGETYDMHIQEEATALSHLSSRRKIDKTSAISIERMKRILSDAWFVYLHIVLHPDLTRKLPNVTENWADFHALSNWKKRIKAAERGLPLSGDRISAFRAFFDEFRPSTRPALYLLHSLLPHVPYTYLPSGKSYASHPFSCIAEFGEFEWGQDSWAVAQGYQRHLLQVGTVDLLIGELAAALKAMGLYGPSLIIVTADHGASFWPENNLRNITESNYSDIMSVPLFIKLPYQKKGVISDCKAENIDILPTIADVLNVEITWPHDGHSLIDNSIPDRASQIIYEHRPGGPWTYENVALARNRTLEHKLSLFGGGSQEDGLLRIGPYSSLLDKRIEEFGKPEATDAVVILEDSESFDDIDLQSPFIPCLVTGKVASSGSMGNPLPLIISINGTISAATQTYAYGRDAGSFSAMLPETAFRKGQNVVEVFIVSGSESKIILRRPKQHNR